MTDQPVKDISASIKQKLLNAPSDLTEIVDTVEAFVLAVFIDSNIANKEWIPAKHWQ